MDTTYGLKAWVDRISGEDLSTLSGVVCHLQSIVGDDEVSLYEVSQAILSDPNLTSRVLRIANSATYNPGGMPISTVSRATVVLGISAIRNLCISVKVIDELLSRSRHERLYRVMSRSLHAAVLSRKLWAKWRGSFIEEVFIAGLLMHLGEAVYWSLGDASGEQIEDALYTGATIDDACHKVLGVRFQELGLGLARAWQLGDLTLEVHRRPREPDEAARLILLVDELVMTWHGADVASRPDLYRRIASVLKAELEPLRRECDEVVRMLPDVADEFGVPALKPFLPVGESPVEGAEGVRPLKGDATLQLSILREMCLMTGDKVDVNALVVMAMEGIYRGIGMDRVAVMVSGPDGKSLAARSVMGRIKADWKDSLHFRLDKGEGSFFAEVLRTGETRWLGHDRVETANTLGAGADRMQFKSNKPVEAFLAPLTVGGRVIGAFYADCAPSERPLTAEAFASFRHFSQQVSLSLKAN